MTSQEIKLSFNQNAVYQCGAALVTIVACAGADPSNRRQAGRYASLCNLALWAEHLPTVRLIRKWEPTAVWMGRQPRRYSRSKTFPFRAPVIQRRRGEPCYRVCASRSLLLDPRLPAFSARYVRHVRPCGRPPRRARDCAKSYASRD
jgi:hypothetical protein